MSSASDNADYRRMARNMLERRRLRGQHFERQALGEQRWDMVLALFAGETAKVSVDQLSQALSTPPATTLALARILAGHGLLELSDSDGGWSDIPISLSALGHKKMTAYFSDLQKSGLAG